MAALVDSKPREMDDWKYKLLLSSINGEFEDGDLHMLKFLCRDKSIDLKHGPLDNCKSGLEVFEMLERKMCLSGEKLGLFVELLDLMDRPDLIEKVKEKFAAEKGNTISSYRKMAVKWADRITDTDLQTCVLSLRRDLKNKTKADIKYPIKMMYMLEDSGKIGPGKVDYLSEIANMLKKPDMKEMVQDYQQEIVIGRYKMDKNPRGLCIIINNIDFSKSNNVVLENRTGSEADQEKLKRTFTKLGFKVKELTNLTADKMKTKIKEASEVDHSEYDCFVCCIMSHGNSGFVTGVDGKTVKIMDIAKYFWSSECPTLVYKPKLFFIESCQGDSYDTKYDPKGVSYFASTSTEDNYNSMSVDDNDPRVEKWSIPDEADFLFAYATSPGRKAKLESKGSIYIRKLTEVLDKHHKDFDILSMLTLVNREVCKVEFEDEEKKTGTIYGQAPAPQFTLRKKLYFN